MAQAARNNTSNPIPTPEQLILLALVAAQKPKVRRKMAEQLKQWSAHRNVRSISRGPGPDADALAASCDRAGEMLVNAILAVPVTG